MNYLFKIHEFFQPVLLFALLLTAISCYKTEEVTGVQFVLKFEDSIVLNRDIPVYVAGEKVTYLTLKDVNIPYCTIFLSDSLITQNLTLFELKRLDYFGSTGLFISYDNAKNPYHAGDTVLVTTDLRYIEIPPSEIDTSDVYELIKIFQSVGKKYHGNDSEMDKSVCP